MQKTELRTLQKDDTPVHFTEIQVYEELVHKAEYNQITKLHILATNHGTIEIQKQAKIEKEKDK